MRPFRPQALPSLQPIFSSVRPRRAFLRGPQKRAFRRTRPWRYPLEGHSQQQSDVVHVDRGRMAVKRAGLALLYTASSWVLIILFFDKLSEALDLDGEQAVELDHEHPDDEEAGFFIPFQYPQKLPRKLYRQSDPEWQEFVRMSNDDSRADAVREELANRCVRDITAAPKIQQMLGTNIELGHYWLDIKYPDGPAPEYQRWGLEITDDYIALAQQTIPHSHYIQLRHILWPKALFAAAFNSIRIFSHLQLIKFKFALSLPLNDKDKQVSAISMIEKGRLRIEAAQAELDSRKDASVQLNNPNTKQPPSLPPPVQTQTTTDPPSTAASPLTNNPLLALLLPNANSPSSNPNPSPASNTLAQSTDLTLARRMFLQTLSATWSRTRLDKHPPGCFYVLGAVEVRGERGRVRCEVQAAYDPKGDGGRGEVKWCVIQVKNFWEWRQRARGGP